jgi:hypothetical protein
MDALEAKLAITTTETCDENLKELRISDVRSLIAFATD